MQSVRDFRQVGEGGAWDGFLDVRMNRLMRSASMGGGVAVLPRRVYLRGRGAIRRMTATSFSTGKEARPWVGRWRGRRPKRR